MKTKTPIHPYVLSGAKLISTLFTPFYIPTVAVVLLLIFSYLNKLSNAYRLAFAVLVIFFTWIFPLTAAYLYRSINGWTHHQVGQRERRFVPYIINIFFYGTLFLLMKVLHIPAFLTTVVMSALILQIICALINIWIKISTHAAASGSAIGMLMAFSLVFNFDALGWLCVAILLSGLVCSSRMVLRLHTYRELVLGVLVGFVSGWCVVFAP